MFEEEEIEKCDECGATSDEEELLFFAGTTYCTECYFYLLTMEEKDEEGDPISKENENDWDWNLGYDWEDDED